MTTYKQIDANTIQFFTTSEDGSITNGPIVNGKTRTRQVQNGTTKVENGVDDEGAVIYIDEPVFKDEVYSPWDELMATNPTIEPIPQSQIDAETAEAAIVARSANKLAAFTFNGVVCSATESDQNGWASIKTLNELVISLGAEYRPIPFVNENRNIVTLDTPQEFIDFILAGVAARTEFFT